MHFNQFLKVAVLCQTLSYFTNFRYAAHTVCYKATFHLPMWESGRNSRPSHKKSGYRLAWAFQTEPIRIWGPKTDRYNNKSNLLSKARWHPFERGNKSYFGFLSPSSICFSC